MFHLEERMLICEVLNFALLLLCCYLEYGSGTMATRTTTLNYLEKPTSLARHKVTILLALTGSSLTFILIIVLEKII